MKKIFAPLIIITAAVIWVSAAFVFTPQPPKTVYAAGNDFTVIFKTVDSETLAEVTTVEGKIPVELIPNAPFILHRPFLRWTNVQGFALDGIVTANITFLPLYSYDPTWDGSDGGNGKGNGGGNDKAGDDEKYFNETRYLWGSYLLTEQQLFMFGFLGVVLLMAAVFVFLKLLRGVFHK